MTPEIAALVKLIAEAAVSEFFENAKAVGEAPATPNQEPEHLPQADLVR